jgi:hypothetical protein
LLAEQTTLQNSTEGDLLSLIRTLPKPQTGMPHDGDFKTGYYEQKGAANESTH